MGLNRWEVGMLQEIGRTKRMFHTASNETKELGGQKRTGGSRDGTQSVHSIPKGSKNGLEWEAEWRFGGGEKSRVEVVANVQVEAYPLVW